MNFDIFIRVIDWFVSICETQHGKRPWLMEEEGEKKLKNNYFCQKSAYHRFESCPELWTQIWAEDRKVFNTHSLKYKGKVIDKDFIWNMHPSCPCFLLTNLLCPSHGGITEEWHLHKRDLLPGTLLPTLHGLHWRFGLCGPSLGCWRPPEPSTSSIYPDLWPPHSYNQSTCNSSLNRCPPG